MKRMREYELYTHGDGEISNRYNPRPPKPWIITVRAVSIKQAYWLLANEELGGKNRVGIVHVDHSHGPKMLDEWPFDFDVSDVSCPWNMEETHE